MVLDFCAERGYKVRERSLFMGGGGGGGGAQKIN
jgi:hypothetical protein